MSDLNIFNLEPVDASSLLHRRTSVATATESRDMLADRRESQSRLRAGHARQSSDVKLSSLIEGSPPLTSVSETPPSPPTPELIPLDFSSLVPGSPLKGHGQRFSKAPLPLTALSRQLKQIDQKSTQKKLYKLFGGFLLFIAVLYLQTTKWRPAVHLSPVRMFGHSSSNKIASLGPSPLLIWCIQTQDRLSSIGAAQSRTWVADARRHGVHVVFASAVDTSGDLYSIYDLPPSLEIPEFAYKDIRLTTINGFRSLYNRHLTDKSRQIRWFMKADDDTYVRIPEMLKAIERAEASGLNPDDVHMIGYPWQDVDMAQWPKPYCWGGPGYLLSRGALDVFGKHADSCYEAMAYDDGIDHTSDQASGIVPSLSFTSDQKPRFGIEYEDMAISRCLDYFASSSYKGCQDFPGGNKTEFLSLWADNEVHQWNLLRDLNMTADLSVWTKQVEDPPRYWNFQDAVSLHKVPLELMDLVHDVYCSSHGQHSLY